jgi:fructose-1,6-bisphosphatase-3
VDADGNFLALKVDGQERTGRALFDALGSLIRRAVRKGADHRDEDADWLWYLWAGPLSPLFGKDRMATFETHFIAEPETHKETKNSYFSLIHDAEFCRKILREFGVSDQGLIVNGHVPVKIAQGEQPVKRGGNAVTIDGAFSEAYGDHGYTLILDPSRIALAEHSHFESVEEAITRGADIIPQVTTLRAYEESRRVADTEQGATIRSTISMLERLVAGYQEGLLVENQLMQGR